MTTENDKFHFEQAERVMRCLRMIEKNADCDHIAQQTQCDPRFVLALMCITAFEEATV